MTASSPEITGCKVVDEITMKEEIREALENTRVSSGNTKENLRSNTKHHHHPISGGSTQLSAAGGVKVG